jgi:hypothetical protein
VYSSWQSITNTTLWRDWANWPTPMAADYGAKVTTTSKFKGLVVVAANWATPAAFDAVRGVEPLAKRKARNQTGQPLTDQAAHFPSTPPASMHGGPGVLLQRWTRPECPRLNAAFQWWLMGWPHPTLIFSEQAATEWTRWRRQLLSELSLMTGKTVLEIGDEHG